MKKMHSITMNKNCRLPLWAHIYRIMLGSVVSALFVGAAYADPTVELQILNATGPNGEIIVVAGEDIEVSFNVTLDTAGVLNKNDTMSLIDLADNSVVSSKNRGKSTSGSIILTVPNNSLAGQYYVRYMTKDGTTEIARISHPDDVDSIPLLVMQESTTAELTAKIAELEAADSIETTSRISADEAEAIARAEADAAERASRIAADSAEATARAQADTIEAASRIAADQAEATARAAADAAETTSRIAADQAEATARAEADAAATAALQAEAAARAAADSAEAALRAAEDIRLQADIDTNAMGIADNAAAIESLQAEISSINIQIDSIKASISSAEVLISGNTSAIADAKLLIESNAGDIVSIQADLLAMISQYSLDNASIQAAIGDIVLELGTLNALRETLANDLSAQLQILSDSITNNTDAISTNMLGIIAINTQVTSINSSILGLNNAVANLEAIQEDNVAAISVLNMRADEFQQEIEQLQASLQFQANLAAGTCPNGTAVQDIQADGSYVCGEVSGTDTATDQVGFNIRHVYKQFWVGYYRTAGDTISCPSGYRMMGAAGHEHSKYLTSVYVSKPYGSSGWYMAVFNDRSWSMGVTMSLVCVKPVLY